MAKTQIKTYVFKPGIGAADNLYPDAYSLLSSNKAFIQKEATAWIQDQVDADASGFVGYTYNQSKCERDVGYIIDAYLNDIRYGGNEKLRNTIKYYWDQGVAQVDGDRQPEIQTHTFIGTLITDYIFANTAYSASNTQVSQTIDVTKTPSTSKYTPTNAVYTPSTGEMVLTIPGHDLVIGSQFVIAEEGITFTCALDGNATEHAYPRSSGVPNDTGRDPFYNVALRVQSVTTDTVTVNVGISSDTSEHTFVSADTNCIDASAATIIDSLVFATVDVITNGLDNMPTSVATGVGKLRFQGRYDLNELLLITNVTSNEIIYSFNDPAAGGLVTLKTDNVEIDSDFPAYLQTTDAITTVTLNYDTREHNSTDEIQIFVEKIENGKSVVTTRPFDFGTDAIERMRVAPALSMLDADFEYGLQPTKWAAIGTLRGYPSVYEIPGTDTSVVSVVTDASAGTDGVGQSLITVTTVGAHGLEAGTPITIKALEDSVVGAARAEGSFVITTIPNDFSFTYYAKSKVGTTNGEVLSTTYTQLREAGFYTGASIGSPTISVLSNGTSGTLVGELDIASGSTIIPFDGPSPELGAPLTNANMPEGTQVTTINDTSAGGGEYLTLTTTANVNVSDTSIQVDDITGVIPNLAVDRGDGTAIYVTSAEGSTVNFSGPFTDNKVANTLTYTNISPVANTPIGASATFNISSSGGTYSLDGIANSGENYQVGDRILIQGNNLGGSTPDNDLIVRVTGLDSAGGIDTVALEGDAPVGDESVSNVSGTTQSGAGSDAVFNVTYEDNVYTADIFSPDNSTNYQVGDIIVIPGDLVLPSSGVSPANDVYITVDSIGAGGSIVTVTTSGTAPDADKEFLNPAFTTSGAGTGVQFTVSISGANYDSVTIDPGNQGINFLPGDTITVLGTDLGGATPDNDLTITIDNVGGVGEITDISISGTAFNGDTVLALPGTNRIGSDAEFNITLNAGTYDITLADGGSGYGVDQTIVIPAGTDIPGFTPQNDITITVTGVDDITTGVITTFTVSGTAYDGIGSFINLLGATQGITGAGFTLNITRTNGDYSTIVTNNSGSGYFVGNSFTITGVALDGLSPINDIEISIDGVDGSGAVTSFTTNYESAAVGNPFRLLSTLIVSEATTGIVLRGENITYGALATLEVVFNSAHGLVPGDTFIVSVNSDDGANNHNLAAGSFFASEIPSTTQLRYQARAEGFIDDSSTIIQGIVYPRPDSFFIHRPYDGGVQLGTGGPQHGAQAIRQSKKYIRYQSGKGIMYTTGALFAPSYDLRSLTADVEVGSLITVVTDDNDHGVQIGGIVRLLGVETPGYNSGPETTTPPEFDYEVVEVVDERTFKIRAQRRLGATDAVLGFGSQMSVVSWHGATVRSGIFDDQNGIFWEYDGTNISVNQRTGTRQLAGTISLAVDDNLITGSSTRFRDQLKAGDRIIIKGMTHVVSHVNSQTECTVTPDWRGVVDITGAKANLIVDKKVKQSDFNLDTLDGAGPSGYDIDIAKMQMIGIQYSWYGAGFIDFMLRGQDGNFIFAHRMRNSNVNTEAFMRSGNLPVRYEVTNEGPSGKLSAAMTDDQTTIPLVDSSFFPTSGTVYIDNEIISFTGNNTSTNTLTGCTRNATFTNFQAGATRSYTAGDAATHDDRTGVILISQTITPLISHWGSAFITDGGFDEDRGYIFSYSETGLEVSTTPATAFMIRLSPSVSNALVGDLGERELLNRAQLLLQSLEITSDGAEGDGTPIQGGIVVEGILNPKNYPLDVNNVTWSTLSSQAQGGQPSFAQVASSGAIVWSDDATETVQTPLTSSFPTGNIEIAPRYWNGRYIENGSRYIVFRTSDLNTYIEDGLSTNDYIDHPNLPSNTQIRRLNAGTFNNGGTAYTWVELNRNGQGNNTSSGTATVEKRYNTSSTSRIWFNQVSWESAGIIAGTISTDTNFSSANTSVNTITRRTYFGTTYYDVTFTSSYTATINPGTTTVEFTFVTPVYAQPGETVFSFIAQPGERATVDFSELKELTNTPLGGRGTYPNGPDVLAINVYKVSGVPSNANIILNWGEAQA
jgi:hypothetical protein